MHGHTGTVLLKANAPELHLEHPTEVECTAIWTNSSVSWGDPLTLPNGGLAQWVLVDAFILAKLSPKRPVSDSKGPISEGPVYGIASVFCSAELRGRGCAARMMRGLAKKLWRWPSGYGHCFGSILHLVFRGIETEHLSGSRAIYQGDIEQLCALDVALVRILPDFNHILWHLAKKEFACNYLFQDTPLLKGEISGPPGSRAWEMWSRRYCDHPDGDAPCKFLYILRLFIEIPDWQTAVLQAAQREADDWKLGEVRLRNPTPVVENLITESRI
ncbi:hypothetical protein BJ878DRAFT_536735 [Calycina marina]|uniref:LYC1 C-terminal domain-containing protein n=1 Tax=Calycina marina TaxID=1763456 RepID=A0A9P7YW37_9HELO|nr:hypothetical protein BJ878DRAFT_536735 [Calycina marina]